jgi:hypothetical protein
MGICIQVLLGSLLFLFMTLIFLTYKIERLEYLHCRNQNSVTWGGGTLVAPEGSPSLVAVVVYWCARNKNNEELYVRNLQIEIAGGQSCVIITNTFIQSPLMLNIFMDNDIPFLSSNSIRTYALVENKRGTTGTTVRGYFSGNSG